MGGVLPDPPTVAERDLYLGPQHRWVAVLSFVGTMLTIASVLYFVGNQPWSAFLLVPLAISVLGAVTSLVTSLRGRRDSVDSHRRVVATWAPERTPGVDVFLPTAGEAVEVLRNTYTHVSRLQWRGELRVMVLDDSARDTVRDLAEEFGFEHHTRPDRGHLKKAGNLRYGFDISDGDIIAVLDADFVPRADYLSELAPYLDDPAVGIVQSPQFFDTTKRMNWVQYAAGSTQILFYRWIQAARDASDAAICVGTCALYRRTALAAAGGFAQIGHSEDVHTGISLIAVGYRVRYVPTVVSKGLCPDTLNQFITQQYRWCTGSMSLMLDRKFHSLRLTAMQRLSYWSGFLYYISTALDIFVVTLPPILLATFSPGRVQIRNYIFVLLALVVRQSVVPIITLDGTPWSA